MQHATDDEEVDEVRHPPPPLSSLSRHALTPSYLGLDWMQTDERIAPKEALLFCVEVSPSMLAPLPDSSSSDSNSAPNTLVAAMELVLDLMKRKVVTNNKDLMGLVLFNTVCF